MKWLRRTLLFLVVCAATVFAMFHVERGRVLLHHGFARVVSHVLTSRWKSRLYTPTMLTKIGPLYFIVDCWHNRVIYSPTLNAPLESWKTLDGDLAGPHSIASDGVVYVTEDTGHNTIRVYRNNNGTFERTQTLAIQGFRPHRTRYDEATHAFYVISANSDILTKLVRNGDQLTTVYSKQLPFLGTNYVRSFTIMDGYLYIVSGPFHITKVRYLDDSDEMVATYAAPAPVASMDDIYRIGDYIYITGTPNAIIRTKSFEDLNAGKWEDVYAKLGFHGTPYYITEFDGRIFIPQITDASGIRSFAVANNGDLVDGRDVFYFGAATWWDERAKESLAK